MEDMTPIRGTGWSDPKREGEKRLTLNNVKEQKRINSPNAIRIQRVNAGFIRGGGLIFLLAKIE